MSNKFLFKSMLKSSLLIMLIPLIAGILSFCILIGTVSSASTTANKTAISSIATQTDRALNNVYNSCLALGETSQYRRVKVDQPTNDDLLEFQQLLKNFVDYRPLVSRVVVFLDIDKIISDSNYRTLEEFFGDDFFNYGIGAERILAELSQYHNKDIRLRNVDSRGIDTNYSLFYQNITTGANTYLSSVVLLVINNAEIKNILNDVAWSSGHLEVVQGNASVTALGTPFSKAKYTATSSGYNLVYQASGQSMFKSGILELIIAGFSVVVCLGVLGAVTIAFLITRKNYQSISVIDSLAKQKADKGAGSLTELAQKVKEFAERYESIQAHYNEDRASVANQLMVRMLKGQALPESRYAMCHRYGIEYANRRFVVVGITSPIISSYVRVLPEGEATEIQRLVYNSCLALISQLFDKGFSEKYLLDFDGIRYFMVLAYPSDFSPQEQLATIKNLCIMYRDSVNKQYKLNTSLAISDTINDIKELNLAFKQADEAQAFIDLLGSENEVVLYSSIDNVDQVAFTKMDDKEAQLANFIKVKDFETAKQLFFNVLDNDVVRAPASMRNLMVDSLVCKVVSNVMGLSAFVESQAIASRVLEVTEAENASGKRASVSLLLEDLEAFYKENVYRSEEVCKKIMEFIDQKYADSNLNVGLIADTFSFSLSYLSRLFKKNTGINILDYIQKRRIDRAKELLKEKMSIADVAEAVGYMESRALIRAFKKQEKITPGKYMG